MKFPLPKITVVTPSFNQGEFIEDTILSVLGQNYANLEYIIIDGGSTDNTVDVIKKYKDKITYWISEKDNGQSHAINKGFTKSTGDILCWLNSDDLYMPNVLTWVAEHLNVEDSSLLFANCLHFKEASDSVVTYGSNVVYESNEYSLENIDYIIQPSSFWTRKVWENVGNLREDIHYAFDWEWFLRAKKLGVSLFSVSKCLSMYRIHDGHKTGSGGSKRQQEILGIYHEYSVRYADLYSTLLSENFSMMNPIAKSINKILSISNRTNRPADIIKLMKYFKYKKYTSAEINGVLSMM